MQIENSKVLLVGASGGIGQEIAKELVLSGAKLLLAGRSEQKLKLLQDELASVDVSYTVVDFKNKSDRMNFKQVMSQYQADIIINCLGVNDLSLLSDMSDSDIANMMFTNLTVPTMLCRDFVDAYNQQKRTNKALIVNVGSILGSIGLPGSSVYCATKFGVRGLSESLRRELANSPIDVLYFAPRATKTALNSAEIDDLNTELGNHVDEPSWVAQQLIKAIKNKVRSNLYLGFPESLFVRINALLPNVVDKSIQKKLSTIIKFCKREGVTS
ncbi:SDR family oxidoreductase [Sessilibacter sp. MAH4]